MSIRSFDAALDFMPDAEPQPSRIVATLGKLIDAIADAKSAQHEYQRLIAKGVPPAEAARTAFEHNFERR